MSSGVLLDTGPLVAYLTERDGHHDWALETFNSLDLPAITCEPVLTEACFLVERNGQPPTRVLDHAVHRPVGGRAAQLGGAVRSDPLLDGQRRRISFSPRGGRR